MDSPVNSTEDNVSTQTKNRTELISSTASQTEEARIHEDQKAEEVKDTI